MIEDVTIFPQGSQMDIFNRLSNVPHSPVIRTEHCHRFCIHVYDKYSSGHWPLVGKMLDCGDVAVVPDPFYKHAQTEPRGELQLTEGWCQDKCRTQYEVFIAQMGCGTLDNALVIADRVCPAYTHGVRFAVEKKEWLTTRNFLMRARAYGFVSDEELQEWEQSYLVQMTAERLKEYISIVPGIKKILVESHLTSENICAALAEMLPQIDISILTCEDLLDCQTTPDQFIIAWDYETLRRRAETIADDPLRQCSLADAFASCRLTQGKLNFV